MPYRAYIVAFLIWVLGSCLLWGVGVVASGTSDTALNAVEDWLRDAEDPVASFFGLCNTLPSSVQYLCNTVRDLEVQYRSLKIRELSDRGATAEEIVVNNRAVLSELTNAMCVNMVIAGEAAWYMAREGLSQKAALAAAEPFARGWMESTDSKRLIDRMTVRLVTSQTPQEEFIVAIATSEGGTVRVGGELSPFSPPLFAVPPGKIQLEAVPAPGYEFAGWSGLDAQGRTAELPLAGDVDLGVSFVRTLRLCGCDLPSAQARRKYSTMLAATGGTAPYLFELADGALPDGLVLDPGRGDLSGTPAVPQTAVFAVKVTDVSGRTAFGLYELVVEKQRRFEDSVGFAVLVISLGLLLAGGLFWGVKKRLGTPRSPSARSE